MGMPMTSYIYASATRRLTRLVREQAAGEVLRIMQMRLCASRKAGLDAQGGGRRNRLAVYRKYFGIGMYKSTKVSSSMYLICIRR